MREIEEETDRKLEAIIDGVQSLSRSVPLPPKLALLLEALPEQVEATRALAEALAGMAFAQEHWSRLRSEALAVAGLPGANGGRLGLVLLLIALLTTIALLLSPTPSTGLLLRGIFSSLAL